MSAFKLSTTKMKDRDCLLKCIEEVEPAWKGKIAVGKDLSVYGYTGDDRTKLKPTNENYCPKAEIVIPGAKSAHGPNLVGGASNDLAFSRNPDGTLSYICSSYDSTRRGTETGWWKSIEAMYNKEKLPDTVKEIAANMVQAAANSGKTIVSQGEMMDLKAPSEEIKQSLGEDLKAIPVKVKVGVKLTASQLAALKAKNPQLAAKLKPKYAVAKV